MIEFDPEQFRGMAKEMTRYNFQKSLDRLDIQLKHCPDKAQVQKIYTDYRTDVLRAFADLDKKIMR